jgi:Ni,Fe-hydrogenase maturation factor
MALEVGRRSGMSLPPESAIAILGIEAADVLTFAETLSPDVEDAVPRAVQAVEEWLSQKEDA